jgi:hypothetical protein
MKFKVGDKVKVVKNLNPEWISYVGQTGEVSRNITTISGFPYDVNIDGGFTGVGFHEEELQLQNVYFTIGTLISAYMEKQANFDLGKAVFENSFKQIWEKALETYPDAKEYKIHISVEAIPKEAE